MISKSKTVMTFIVAAFAVFLATFNETFMNVALAPMAQSLGVDGLAIQWVVTAYLLGAAIMVPISAFLYRKVPTKILFLITIGFFIIGSLLGGLSKNSFILVLLSRILQAIGSGMLIPVAMNIVLDIAPREKLGFYMGTMGAMTTLGPSISVILAGALLNLTNGDFHILFWVFGALTFVCFVLAIFFISNVAKLTKPKLDIISVVYISFALIGIMFSISFVFKVWWIALIAFVVGVIFMILFVLRQKKLETPLINLEPLKVKQFSLSVILNMISLIVVFAFNVLLPMYLQNIAGYNPLTASLALFPAIFLSCVIAPIAGKIFDKHGPKLLLIIGFLMMFLFSVLLAIFISTPSIYLIALLYVPLIVGSALIIGPIQSYGLSSLKPEQNPHGVTIFSTGFQIAGCIGASLFLGIYEKLAQTTLPSTSFLIVGLIVAFILCVGLIISVVLTSKKAQEQVLKKEDSAAPTLSSVMKTNVYKININASILDAMQMMVEKKISGMPVVDDNDNLVAYLSDGDIMRYLSKNQTNIKFAYAFAVTNGNENEFNTKVEELSSLKVSDVATTGPFFVDINDDFGEVCKKLANSHKKKVPVLENGKMVGVINRSEITKYVFASCLKKEKN
ncbi:MAG: MFS transporter [Clostridia bacterium]|nr:MFS transporter [Clostridia bacterium]